MGRGGDGLALTCLHGQVIVELVQHGHGHVLVLGLAELQGTDRTGTHVSRGMGTVAEQLQTPDRTTGVWLSPAPPALTKSPGQRNIPGTADPEHLLGVPAQRNWGSFRVPSSLKQSGIL